MTLTAPQIELARHALGLTNGRRRSFRNHFVAGPGHEDFDDWEAMTAAGMAKRFRPSALTGGDFMFCLTKAGATAALKPGEQLDPEDFP